jgi:hypothetical protein
MISSSVSMMFRSVGHYRCTFIDCKVYQPYNLILIFFLLSILFCRSGASLLNSSDSASQNKRWPEDIAWHPEGNRLFSVYTADGGDSQVSITDLNKQGV